MLNVLLNLSIMPFPIVWCVVVCVFSFPVKLRRLCIYPYLTNELSHHYQLDESIFIFRGVRSDFYFYLIIR